MNTIIGICGKLAVLMGLCLAIISCNNRPSADRDHNVDLPLHIDTLANLQVFSAQEQDFDTVRLVEEQVYESNQYVLMPGYINELAVDSKDRVYIKSSIPGALGIFVFGPQGDHITTIGQHGKGPGEFQVISDMAIQGDRLYVYDSHQFKLAVFSLTDFSLLGEEIFSESTVVNTDSSLVMLVSGEFYPMRDGTIRMQFITDYNSNDNPQNLLYEITGEGDVIPEPILEQRRYRNHNIEMDRVGGQNPLLPFTTPFSRHSLLVSSSDDSLFAAWTEDFLIKVYDTEGNYSRAIYYPYENRPLDIITAESSSRRRQYLQEHNQVPDNWPALHHMLIDDKDRIWAFTITDSDSSYQGWVMDRMGNLLARFTYPEDRSSRFVKSPPLLTIRKGYMYKNERDIRAGIDRIIKYRFEFHPRPNIPRDP